mgnify:CR=1 FL=1
MEIILERAREYILALKDAGNFTFEDMANMSGVPLQTVRNFCTGKTEKNPGFATIAKLVKGLMYSTQVGALYDKYPANYEDFKEWKEKADKLWAEIGSVAENTCDPAILKKLGYE